MSTTFLKENGSVTARSARILRSSATLASFCPWMKSPYLSPCSRVPALMRWIHSARMSRFTSFRSAYCSDPTAVSGRGRTARGALRGRASTVHARGSTGRSARHLVLEGLLHLRLCDSEAVFRLPPEPFCHRHHPARTQPSAPARWSAAHPATHAPAKQTSTTGQLLGGPGAPAPVLLRRRATGRMPHRACFTMVTRPRRRSGVDAPRSLQSLARAASPLFSFFPHEHQFTTLADSYSRREGGKGIESAAGRRIGRAAAARARSRSMSFFRVFPAPDAPVPLSELELRAQSHAEANSLTLAMHGWLRMMPWLKYTSRNERLLSAALRKRQAGVCRACLHALVLNYSRKHERQPLVTDHGRRSRLLGAWCTWMRATLDTKQRQHVFKCLQMRASSRRMSQTTATRMAMTHESRKYWCAPFVAWRELIRRRRRLLRLCKDVTKRYTSSIVADKFHWWVHAYLNWLHLRESVGNLFHRVSFRLSSHAFLEWTALIQENHRLLMLGTKALLRWEIFLMRQGFMALAVHGRDARKVMTAFKLVSARRQKNRIRSSFRRLKDQASQRVRLRAMHVRALNLWMRSIRTKFLLRWWDKVHDAHRITNALSKKKSLHMTGRLLSGSMDEWRMIAVQNRKHEGWATSKSRLHVRRALHDVLKIWHMHMYGQRTFNRVAGRISHLNKMHLRKRVFEAWRSDFGKRKHNLLTVSRALARRHFGAIRHYLDVWCGETQRMKRMKRICVDHVHCTGARKVMECFFQWRAHTTAQKRLIVAAAKIITRRDFVRVAGYFYFLARLTIKWKQISIWCDKMERSTTRWAFCLWCDERLRCMQKDRKWQYTAAKMMQGLVKRLFHHWRSSHVETKLDKRIVKKIAMRIGAYASIAPHVQHWRSLIKRRNMLNRTLRLKRLREKPALTNRYFKMWNDRTEYRRMVWSVSRRIKIRWFAMVGTQAFYVWRRHLSTRANEKALLHNMAIHRHFHFCAGFFAAWEEHVREGKRIELTRSRAEEHDKTTKLSDMQERLLAAEKLAHSAAEEKTALADELATAREERAAAYRVIEALNASEQGTFTSFCRRIVRRSRVLILPYGMLACI